MVVEVLLMKNVEGLGKAGEIVKVAGGYARNFLLPRKLAQPTGHAAVRQFEKQRREDEALAKQTLAEARKTAEALSRTSCTLHGKTTDGTTLYGSIGSADIAAALAEQGFDIERRQIELSAPFKEVGIYDVNIRLHSEVAITFKVWIVDAAK